MPSWIYVYRVKDFFSGNVSTQVKPHSVILFFFLFLKQKNVESKLFLNILKFCFNPFDVTWANRLSLANQLYNWKSKASLPALWWRWKLKKEKLLLALPALLKESSTKSGTRILFLYTFYRQIPSKRRKYMVKVYNTLIPLSRDILILLYKHDQK